MKIDKSFWSGVALMIGTAIGAGIFGIPYVIAKVGFIPGILYILVLGAVILLTTLCYGEVVLRTKEKHQLPGYANKYLGVWGKRISLVAIVFSIFGAMLAYTIEIGVFLNALFSPVFGGSPRIYSLIFYALAAMAIYVGLKTVANIEKIMVAILLLIIAGLFIFGISEVNLSNFTEFNAAHLLLPYGVILFALGAGTAVPDARFLLGKNPKKLLNVISIGVIVPLIVYLIFTFLVVGITGTETTESAIIGLGLALGPIMLLVGAIFGVLSMSTSFLALGNVLKETFMFDFKVKKLLAWLIVMVVPLIIYLFDVLSFIEAIGFAGGVVGGVEGIIMVWMFHRAKKKGDRKPEYDLKIPQPVLWFMYVIFFGGIIYVLWEGLTKWFV
ncbi:hypothetical protein KKC88_02800 [Patescibacteria group bacterium]|nr:hypothetical protein [Patescibacteria group bacterium]MBU1672900.1 hypothetical protein [Patescibacteria group bacterium]MBU1963151.1 hypothetical protein [Patescibacteria group bacterium]